jgi:hypothetical protein
VFELSASCLLGRCSITGATSLAFFALGYFSDRVLCFLPRLAVDSDLLIYDSHVALITKCTLLHLACLLGQDLTNSLDRF